MHDDKIRHKLSDRFADYGREPSESVWEAIELHLDEEDRSSDSSGSGLMWWSLAILGLTFASWGIFSNATINDSVELAVAVTQVEKIEKENTDRRDLSKNSNGKIAQSRENNAETNEQLNAITEDGNNEKSIPQFSTGGESKSVLNRKVDSNPQKNGELEASNQPKKRTSPTSKRIRISKRQASQQILNCWHQVMERL